MKTSDQLMQEFVFACENFYESIPIIDRDGAEHFFAEQCVTLLSNILERHPELEQEVQDFIDYMRTI